MPEVKLTYEEFFSLSAVTKQAAIYNNVSVEDKMLYLTINQKIGRIASNSHNEPTGIIYLEQDEIEKVKVLMVETIQYIEKMFPDNVEYFRDMRSCHDKLQRI